MPTLDIAATLTQVDAFLDAAIPQIDKAVPLLRQVVEADPDHLYAVHNLNWCFDASRNTSPGRWQVELRDEQWRLRDKVLALTLGTQPGTLSLEQKARALALSQWAEAEVSGYLPADKVDVVQAALDEAVALRAIPNHASARRGLDAWRVLHAARAAGNDEEGYRTLARLIEETPTLRIVGIYDPTDKESFAGLQGVFSDEGFLAWLRAQKPAPHPDGDRATVLDKALLLASGYDANAFFGVHGRVPGRVGRLLALRLLGANVETRDSEARTPLHYAALIGEAALVSELLALGASVAAVDSRKATPLHLAVEKDGLAAIATLVANRAPLDAVDANGRTPLFEAPSAEVANALLEAGADPNGGEGWTPLHRAARSRDRLAVIDVLLARGADPSRKDATGKTPAEVALDYDNAPAATLIRGRAKDGGSGAHVVASIDVKPLVDMLAARKEALLEAWYFDDSNVRGIEQVLETVGVAGDATWDKVAERLQGKAPWTAMAIVELARDSVPAEEGTPQFTKGARFVRGSLVLEGDIHLSAPLLVTGDLTVDGVLRNAGPEGMLIVGGSVRVRALDTDGEVIVGKDLDANVVWGHHNDNSLRVGGRLRAEVVISDDHDIQAEVEASHYFENGDFFADSDDVKALFIEAVAGEEGVDREKVFGMLRERAIVLR